MGFPCHEMSCDSGKLARLLMDCCNHDGRSTSLCVLLFSSGEQHPGNQHNQNDLAAADSQYELRIGLSSWPFRYHFPGCIDTKRQAFYDFLPSNPDKILNGSAANECLHRTQGTSPHAERSALSEPFCTGRSTSYGDHRCTPRRTACKSKL